MEPSLELLVFPSTPGRCVGSNLKEPGQLLPASHTDSAVELLEGLQDLLRNVFKFAPLPWQCRGRNGTATSAFAQVFMI